MFDPDKPFESPTHLAEGTENVPDLTGDEMESLIIRINPVVDTPDDEHLTKTHTLLHSQIDCISPIEFCDILQLAAFDKPKLTKNKRTSKPEITMTTGFGKLRFLASNEALWSEDDPVTSVTLECMFHLNPFAEASVLNKLMLEHPIGQLLSHDGHIIYRLVVNFKGGVCVESILWSFIDFTKSASQIHSKLVNF